jgi:trk system potassium uptake protein TrkH
MLNIAEIRLFNSLNLSMTIVSNGGFLPTNSLGQIFNDQNEIFLLAALFLSMINIFFLFNIINKKKLINYHQEDLYLIFFAFALSFILYFLLQDLSLKQILINVISSLSNSGLTLSNSSENMTLLFLILCIIGGSIISNSSGIKLVRFYILLKTASSEILKLVRPNNVFNNKIFFSDKKIDIQIVNLSFLIFISFFISIFILSSVLVLDNINFENSFKLSVLTLTNTTNSSLFGLENINFANFYTNTKLFLIIFMIIGKIELISLFLIFKKILFKD